MLTRLSRMAAKRRWALLLLLPYLLLCGFGEALHNHSPFEELRSSVCTSFQSAVHASEEVPQLSTNESESSTSCLICQWHAQSGAVVQAPFDYSLLATVSFEFPSASEVALLAHAHTLRTRGPPAPPFSTR